MMNRMKHYKGRLWLSSLLTLLPIPAGFLLWNRLPNSMAIHWGANGEADGYGGKLLAILLPSLILLAVHWLCMLVTFLDKSNDNQNEKVFGLIFWVCPSLSILLGGFVYGFSLGLPLGIFSILYPIIGIPFALIGNYMPKCKQNNTIGIKIYWTLVNEENWNATHRFCGKVWVICGLLFLAVSFLPMTAFFAAAAIIFIPAVILPFIYSYLYHRKLKREGIYTESTGMLNGSKSRKLALLITLPVVVIATAFSLFVSFTGEIEPVYSEDSFTLKASFYEDATLFYDDIANIELRAKTNVGSRVIGIGSFRLFIGSFTNNEFGSYTRYTYTATESEIVIKLEDGRVFVINGKNEEDTKAIYETINGYIGG